MGLPYETIPKSTSSQLEKASAAAFPTWRLMYNLPSVLTGAGVGLNISAQVLPPEGIEATTRCLFAYPADAAIVVLLENEQRSCRMPHDGQWTVTLSGGRLWAPYCSSSSPKNRVVNAEARS
jgi:hypothetical protein